MSAPAAWEPVIGLEIHVQLKTETKMFCRCRNGFGDAPNSNVCPICLAFPGSLPVPNRRAIEECIKLGLALDCAIAERAVFHRKNYFYPDLPKGYQISQYDEPLCVNGKLAAPTADGELVVGITRAHLEEDAAKNVHVAASGRLHGATATLVDFNRGGTPLVEIVTEPDLRDAETAKRFLQLLRQTVVELGLSDAELDKGSMRFDVNVSVRPAGSDELRTRTELKNMNSFNFAAKGIEREIARQIRRLRGGRHDRAGDASLRPGSRGLASDALEGGGAGLSLLPRAGSRSGSSAGRARCAAAREIGELPGARIRGSQTRCRSTTRTCLSRAVSTGCGPTSSAAGADPKRRRTSSRTSSWRPASTRPAWTGSSSRSSCRRVVIPRAAFDEALAKVGEPRLQGRPVPRAEGRRRRGELDPVIDRIIAANAGQAEHTGGKHGLLGYFVGQVMKEMGGKADARVVNDRVRAKLGG